MKIALCQINPTIGDFQGQSGLIRQACRDARSAGCDLAVFPELALCGYPPRDLLEQKSFVQANRSCLEHLVDTIHGIGVVVGLVAENDEDKSKPLFNSAVLFEDGKILHQVNKQLLPTYDVFDERRYFEPGQPALPVTYKGLRLGFTICEDAWNDKDVFKRRLYAANPVSQLAEGRADVIFNLSASPFEMGKRVFRDEMLSSAARKHNTWIMFVNQVGGNDHVLFDGASSVFNPQGQLVARGAQFRTDLVIFDTKLKYSKLEPAVCPAEKQVLEALIMGTRDYVHKCGFKKAVIGLSGGIDSAITACIAVQALGKDNVSTVFMPSRYTSKDNYEDTLTLAKNLGVFYDVIAIDAIFATFAKALVPKADPDNPGITEQNLQARIRGTLLMGISNRDGSIVLTTGNKSELAVGYCTLYGDMNGGLAVISDVPKTIVYDICRYINSQKKIIPQRILDKPPSAELKPGQTDQDDLPPYEIIDSILKGYVEESLGADELIDRGFESQVVQDVIRRVDLNEYKRHQAAPGLKVTAKAFGQGRRYPIAKRFRPVS